MNEAIEILKRDIDSSLIRENLNLSYEQRILELMALLTAADEFARAGRVARGEKS